MLLIQAVFPPLNKTPQAQEYLLEGQANVVSFFYQFLSVCIRGASQLFSILFIFHDETARKTNCESSRGASICEPVFETQSNVFPRRKSCFMLTLPGLFQEWGRVREPVRISNNQPVLSTTAEARHAADCRRQSARWETERTVEAVDLHLWTVGTVDF